MSKQKKNISLRTKLIRIIVPIVLIIIISFFVLSRDMVLKLSKDKMLVESQAYTEEINAWTQQIFSELQIYKDSIESGSFENDAEILAYMEGSVEKNEAYPVGLYMGDDSGVYLDASGWVPDDDWVLVERDWYVDGKDNEEFAFSEPYYDSMVGDMCVSASVRTNYDKAVRVLATDIYLDYVVGLVSDIATEGEVGSFLVTQDTATIIAHPDTEMLAQTLDAEGFDSLYANIGEEIKAGKDGIISVKGDGSKYYVTLNKVDNTNWYLVTYIKEREMLSDLHWMEMYMVLIAVAAAFVLIFAILRVTGQVVKPVQKVTDVIGQIAEGDFTQNLEVRGNDEIAVMTNNMQMFISSMRETITEISRTADWLNKQSLANERVSNSLMDASRNQEGSMSLMDKLAEILSNQAEEVSKQMDYLAELVRQTNEDGISAKSLMRESVGMSQSGKKDMEHINDGMDSINRSINTLSAQIEKVGASMSQIDDMVSMIMDIAEETNLLSLNASIEAARAGESGRGFAVVAEQIGKLAANSSTAADDIAKLTEDINNTVEAAVQDMEASVAEVERNVEIVSEAKTTFVDLYGKVEETSRRVEQMIESIAKVDEVANHLDDIMSKQNIVASQISDSAKEMNETTESMTTSSNVVAESAEELKKESIVLMEKMNKFKV